MVTCDLHNRTSTTFDYFNVNTYLYNILILMKIIGFHNNCDDNYG